jgi:DNA repair photolyase
VTGERHAWACDASYVLLRLPLEVRKLFSEWLRAHYPDKLKHVLSSLCSAREGKLYDSRFGARTTGSGPYAWMIGRRSAQAGNCDYFERTRQIG